MTIYHVYCYALYIPDYPQQFSTVAIICPDQAGLPGLMVCLVIEVFLLPLNKSNIKIGKCEFVCVSVLARIV